MRVAALMQPPDDRPAPSDGTARRHRHTAVHLALGLTGLLVGGCASDPGSGPQTEVTSTGTSAEPTVSQGASATSSSATELSGEEVDIGGGRTLYVRCTGTGAPTVVMEAGDGDTSDSYRFAESAVASATRTCVYDRANLGRSGPAPGPRGLPELVGDLEQVLGAAGIPGPYVLVGTSGGGYIAVGYATAHPEEIAGLVLVETPAPYLDPPPEIVAETAWDHPSNVERRDFLQVEKDAWAGRTTIGDIPVTIISNEYGPDAELEVERRNVEDQRGWLVLSPLAAQVVVRTGHAVEERDPALVVDAILEVVEAAR